MNRNDSEQVVIVTGASRGIGKAIAQEFARQGAKVVLAARSVEDLANVRNEIERSGGIALSVPTDITSPEAVSELVNRSTAKFGRIDVLVNNAGVGRVGGVEDPSFAGDVLATMQASLFGMISMTSAVLPTMRRQNSGVIVNMSSVMGRKAFAKFGSYAIAMHGVTALSDALRQELSGTGIKVSVIHPALTATELLGQVAEEDMPPPFRHLTPLSPAQVAKSVVDAVRRRRTRAVIPATANMLILGEAISPSIGDRIARQLARGGLAKLLGLSSGRTYHETIKADAVAQTRMGS